MVFYDEFQSSDWFALVFGIILFANLMIVCFGPASIWTSDRFKQFFTVLMSFTTVGLVWSFINSYIQQKRTNALLKRQRTDKLYNDVINFIRVNGSKDFQLRMIYSRHHFQNNLVNQTLPEVVETNDLLLSQILIQNIYEIYKENHLEDWIDWNSSVDEIQSLQAVNLVPSPGVAEPSDIKTKRLTIILPIIKKMIENGSAWFLVILSWSSNAFIQLAWDLYKTMWDESTFDAFLVFLFSLSNEEKTLFFKASEIQFTTKQVVAKIPSFQTTSG